MLRRRAAIIVASLSWAILVACAGLQAPPAPVATPAPTPTSAAEAAARVQSTIQAQQTISSYPTPSPTLPGRPSDDPTAVVVFADSSLGGALSELGGALMLSSASVTGVSYKFETSDKLSALIQRGADADVFISTDARQMDALQQASLLDGSEAVLARNGLVIVVSNANPQGIQALKDLGNPGIRFIVPAPTSGTTATILSTFDRASQDPAYGADFRTRAERNILARDGTGRFAVGRVAAGEVSAALVYSSDVDAQSRSKVQIINLPDAINTLVDYPIAVIKNGSNTQGGHAFMNYVLSSKAQDVLSRYGFLRATP